MRRIKFEAKDIFGKTLGDREIVIGSGVVNAYSQEIGTNS